MRDDSPQPPSDQRREVLHFADRSGGDDPRRGAPGRLGMALFLVSLGMLFAASLLAIAIVRFKATAWAPEGFRGVPAGLWASTLVILGASVAAHRAVAAARRRARVAVERGLVLTLMAGTGFLLLQAVNWLLFVRAGGFTRDTLLGFSFYVLTGLHGLHVLGGLVALALVLRLVRRSPREADVAGPVELTAYYWHFVDAAWLVVFAAILFLF
ncbi:MAG: cytochrome c oxidase subunit 3 [Acidobacteriota bacterium]